MGLRARALHKAGNWLVPMGCSDDLNTVSRTTVLVEVANCAPALTLFMTKCYRAKPAYLLFQMTPGSPGQSHDLAGVQQRGAMGPPIVCLRLRPG